MTCRIFYSSEYIKVCDISKFGEGCEKCIPIFKSDWMLPIIIIGVICIMFLLVHLLTKVSQNKIGGKR